MATPAPLRFRPDGTLTIAQFTDLHFLKCGEEDERTLALMGRVLDAERPDLVAYSGDMVSGWECTDPARALRMALSPAVDRKVPFAAVFGNHDDEGPLTRAQLMAVMQDLPGCRAEPGPAALPGVGNYIMRIRESAGDRTAAALHFIDSLAYPPKGRGQGTYAWISVEQGAWHKAECRALEVERSDWREAVPALAYFHMPLSEYHEVWDTRTCRGEKHEEVCSPAINGGFFTALLEAGHVLGTFVGHDHINDYEGDLHGIRLCYGRGGGYAAYGREGFLRGARVVRLHQGKRSFETWCRLEDGSVHGNPPLHAPEHPPAEKK